MGDQPDVPNVLAARYVSSDMLAIWSPEAKIRFERDLWIAVMRGQSKLGLAVDDSVIEDYEAVVDQVDLASIADRERASKHDVKARIDEFNALAGHEHVHKGMTSRDLTENVEQMQVLRSLRLVRSRALAALARLSERSIEFESLAMVGRSHNVAGQPTTMGKRFTNAAEELLVAFDRVSELIGRYPLRGLKGPMGTQQDLVDLLGSADSVDQLEYLVAEHLGFEHRLDSVGQVYPRSMDFDVVSALLQLASGPTNFCMTLRLMAGNELATEGFADGQVGSSAMPHKMNARSSERVCGFQTLLRGYVTMVGALAGDQWNEGDVSCSVVRRVALPDAFFAIDGLFETFLTIVEDFGAYPAVIDREVDRYLPFLATTKLLMTAVKSGMGREDAHEVIREHAVAAALQMREAGSSENDLIRRLGDDSAWPLDMDASGEALVDPIELTGLASSQVRSIGSRVALLVAEDPQSASYRPGDIL